MNCRHEESMWGRCTRCGMTWQQQEAEQIRQACLSALEYDGSEQ